MPKIRVARETLQAFLWPDMKYKVRIVGASFEKACVVLDIEGDDLPEAEFVRALVRNSTETSFRPV